MANLKICKHGNGYGYCFLHVDYCNAIKCVYRDICDEPCYEAAHEEELKQKMFFCSNGEPKAE